MSRKVMKDEYLEKLWNMKENEKRAVDDLKSLINGNLNFDTIDELASEDLVEFIEDSGKITLTEKGKDYAREIIRAHRLAERLIYDVIGGDYELAACEFEHTITRELVDGVCTLLGHPRECPHGMPIPEGECCTHSARYIETSIIPLTELKAGQSARIAYITRACDQRLHKLDSLQTRPGAMIKMHQKYPCHVVECEGVNIALDNDVASSIHVWKESRHFQSIANERKRLNERTN
ncbi:MAG: metal-dependent transcriptional regulator [bacterium]